MRGRVSLSAFGAVALMGMGGSGSLAGVAAVAEAWGIAVTCAGLAVFALVVVKLDADDGRGIELEADLDAEYAELSAMHPASGMAPGGRVSSQLPDRRDDFFLALDGKLTRHPPAPAPRLKPGGGDAA